MSTYTQIQHVKGNVGQPAPYTPAPWVNTTKGTVQVCCCLGASKISRESHMMHPIL